jgi:hypothetical protein
MQNNELELQHYGVKGMKWGHRKVDRRVEKGLYRAGRQQGRADYYKSKGAAAAQKHETNAKVFDKTAKRFESEGKYFRAEAARKAASALRARGANVKASQDAIAKKYEQKATKITEKVNKYATKKRVDLGKKRIDEILKKSKQDGFDRAQQKDNAIKEAGLREALGDIGYEVLDKVRGR